MKQNIVIENQKEKELISDLQKRTDTSAERVKRLLALPDLSRKEGNLLKMLIDRVMQIPQFADFDIIEIPEIISTKILFDLFNFAADHPARSESDTYYVDTDHVLRTHDTVFWYYYLQQPQIQEKIKNQQAFGTFCYGKVYRKDEIDRTHANVFHQMGALYLAPDSQHVTFDDLKNALTLIVQSLFGKDVKFRFSPETFPYTDPSIEVEVELGGKWMELLGSGMPKKEVLKNFGLEGYSGWAFGFGLDRIGMMKMQLLDIRILRSDDTRITDQFKNPDQKFKEVSKYPPISRDISFVINKNVALNNYYELVRDIGGSLIEEVKLMDEYENDQKFGAEKKSYTFHIVYRSLEKTLTDAEVNQIHDKITEKTKEEFGAVIR